jgi:LacI family sucrose operon transcriptional repressor
MFVRVNISDIAKAAGVAKSTVSRFLNGGYVSEATKKKIEKIIEETGFEPNAFAQSLKAKKTNLIGVIVPRLDSFATAKTLIGIDEKLKELNYQMLVSNTSQSTEREIEMIYSLARQKVAGIILLATEITEQHTKAFEDIQLPIVLIGQEYPKYHCLIHDDFRSAYELGEYIIKMGHKKIAFLGVTEKDISVGFKRKEGFKKAVESFTDCEVRYYVTGFGIEDAIDVAANIIREYKPSIIVCSTDNIALGAMKAIFMNGLKIPGDISVTGFGGYQVSEIIHPGLTTIQFYYKDAGAIAAANIVKLVNGEDIPKLMISGYKFVERESVDKI